MKSDIFTGEHEIEHILSETERFGVFNKLPPSASGKLRLLAEEMLSLTVRMFDNLEYEFFIKNTLKRFRLHLSADTLVNQGQKDKLMSLSTRGENSAERGFIGKISGIFQSLIMGEGDYERIYIPHYDSMGLASYFSLTVYMYEMPQKERDDQWDGLEKSIIGTLAKDMVIGVKAGRVEMIATIEF